MDGRNPDCSDANSPSHPWSLDSGGPCRNDGFVGLAGIIQNDKRIVRIRKKHKQRFFYVASLRLCVIPLFASLINMN